MPRLDGVQAECLQKLIAKWDPNQFEVFFRAAVETPLANVVYVKQPFNAVAMHTVEWLEFSNKTFDFLVAFRELKKAVAEIVAFCDPIIQQGRDYVPPGPAALTASQVNEEMIVFRTTFQQRRELFQYLEAYKTLHDVIQKLQDQLGALRLTAQQFRATPDLLRFEPILIPILDDLSDMLLAAAERSRPLTEYPDDFDWVDGFKGALESLRRAVPAADHAAIDGAIDVLAAIPQRQAVLNVELVRSAERLLRKWDAPGQVARILSVPTVRSSILAADLEPFRSLCLELGKLTVDHNLCQDVEEPLAVADAKTAVADGIVGWPDVYAGLLRLAARHPAEAGAVRLAAYTNEFAAAKPPQSAVTFALLRSQFSRQFNRIDETLVTVTRELVRVATRLSQNFGDAAWKTSPP